MNSEDQLKSKIEWVTLFRLIVISILFISTIIVNYFKEPKSIFWYHLYILIFITYVATLLFSILLKFSKKITLLAWFQIPVDIIIITDLVILTGGVDSAFSFLYFISIMVSGYILYSKGGFIAAGLSSIVYSIPVISLHGGFIEKWRRLLDLCPYNTSDLIRNLSFYCFSFFLLAFLTSYLMEKLKKAGINLEERDKTIKNLEEIHNRIVQNIKSGVLTIDNESKILTFNRSAEKLTGYRFDDVVGKSIDSLFAGLSDHLQVIRIDDGTIMLPNKWDRYWTNKEGKKLFLRFSLSPMVVEGGTKMGDIILFDDLTEQMNMEEEIKRKEKMAAIGRLAGAIAHEIRNPLASISGSIEVLKSTLQLKGEDKSLMDIIIRETDRLNNLITDFLTLTKPSKKRVVDIDLRGLIGETITTFLNEEEIKSKYRIIARYMNTDKVSGDPDMLKQVLWNLLMNAAESMPQGGDIEVHISNNLSSPENIKGVTVSITDHGAGIPEDILTHIFEPFFTTKERGTGLGLAIVYSIIEAHGGKIDVASEVGKGTRFDIFIPTERRTETSKDG